ncbi:hydroxyacid dehydrogenase [Pseudactinotalea sp.]|uniref:hydroxyacid dehydrogenase n=1 Tax=Pseudactinotalea sp. TaxID=1926260 RepID=UPI003B3B1ADB
MERPQAAAIFGAGIADQVLSGVDRARWERLVDADGLHTSTESLLATPQLAQVQVLLTGWGGPRLRPELLARMPALQLVLYAAGSVRHLATDEFWDREIALVSAADANNEPVADYVHAAIVMALKGEHHAQAHLRRERSYPSDQGHLGIYGQIVGLVGFGSIARKVAARLRALETTLLVFDPYLTAADAEDHGVERVETLVDLFERSQVVSVHAPWISGVNDGMIGRSELEALPHGAAFLNTARGALVDEAALADVLRARPDLFANLDVTRPEPPEPDSPLWDLPNVRLTGHIAGSIGTERTRLGRLVIDELERWLAGQELRHRVTAEEARTRA